MKKFVLDLVFVPTVKRFTVSRHEQSHILKQLNEYPAEHPDYFWEHRKAFVKGERLEELKNNDQGVEFRIVQRYPFNQPQNLHK